MKQKKFCLCLDLKDDPELIKTYKNYHSPGNVWPEVLESIRSAGIENMEIFLSGNRMFMIMTVDDHFDIGKKIKSDAGNAKVQEWESLMWKFQEALPWAAKGEKWIQMEKIFNLEDHETTKA